MTNVFCFDSIPNRPSIWKIYLDRFLVIINNQINKLRSDHTKTSDLKEKSVPKLVYQLFLTVNK
ncbi:hypothetical protein BpHYR1_008998 [Brachionus plicatilis]|uniref:Uncharacterized protein n=1 Tax=Brachionus plicatilis TaxID=10195 RepID=A0A3M7QD06_BRAPC|nr:hypothetical protein BpHYR1_008998 [Brachionus plicatilis]